MLRSQAGELGLGLRASLELQGFHFRLGHIPACWAKQQQSLCVLAEGRRVRLHDTGNILQGEFIFRSDSSAEGLFQGTIMTLPIPRAWQEVHFAMDHVDFRQITQLGNGVGKTPGRLHGNCQMEQEKSPFNLRPKAGFLAYNHNPST